MNKNPYYRHRLPAEIINHCVWLYNSFSLSYRDIEKMMLDGIRKWKEITGASCL